LGDKIEKNVKGGACSTYGKRRDLYRVLVRKPDRKRNLEDPSVDGRRVLRRMFRKWSGSMDWIDLAQDRGR
jgi:hypothetical protein